MSQSLWGRSLLCRSCAHHVTNTCKQIRPFSSSQTHMQDVPVFKPTSSEKLDSLLNKFRETVFIPASLTQRHQRLIYRDKYAGKLQQQPVFVNVGRDGSEKFQLRHLDFQKSPRTTEFREVVRLLKTREDWYAFTPFLSGLRASKRKLEPQHWEWVIRQASRAGMQDLALKWAVQSKHTGLTLKYPGVARQMFQSFFEKGLAADFKGEEVVYALKLAKQAAMLLNAPEHTWAIEKEDPKRQPFTIGVLLELAAARAIDAFEGKDEEGDVNLYTTVLMANWRLGTTAAPKDKDVFLANSRLLELLPMWHGLKLAMQIEDIKTNQHLWRNLAMRLNELEQSIDAIVERVKREDVSSNLAGLRLCEQLYHK
ncbi:hypothetical protein AJ80_01158 [Polytolypa hystricis UAMH7299]|uniref:Uncharacterized protein n=1 Tax=Polytolypa hystricis (strain UAMH7299) TaxID=1447883 RepID=A0A2B7Z1K0_POLH7|nr:hypothetical protein AJ80_01158 [Polytolypa hystricis UAMH7299]